jgi:uncharacterized protein (UPF0332 family)
MAMDPFQFLILAEQLLKTHPFAVGHRSAISRAYYAAHHCIKAFVEDAGVTMLASANVHADVCRHLFETGDDEIESVGSDLGDLQSSRNDADYKLHVKSVENATIAEALVATARRLIETTRRARQDAARYEKLKAAFRERNRVLRGL